MTDENRPDGVAPDDAYMLLQTLFGAWPAGLSAADASGLSEYAERVVAWQEKALREAKLRSSWEAPDSDYETRCHDLARALLDPTRSLAFLDDLTAFVAKVAPAAAANGLAQVALRYTVPGVPDLYQGTEATDLSLVDPDNRRPVDYPCLQASLNGKPPAKMALIQQLLTLRRDHPALFAKGAYEPIAVNGPRADQVIAFRRIGDAGVLRCVVPLRCAERHLDGIGARDWWGDTTLASGEPLADLLAERSVSIEMLPAGR